jgi:uncharacterized protein (DUF2384 family)
LFFVKKLNLVIVKRKNSTKPKAEKRFLSGGRMGAPGHSALAEVEEFQELKELCGLSVETLASVLGTTARNIQYKKVRKVPFDLPLTERLRKLSLLFLNGIEIFSSKEKLFDWLDQPAYGLDYAVPLNLLGEPGGLDKLLAELSAIKYGDTI